MSDAVPEQVDGIDLATGELPFETEALRASLQAFLDQSVDDLHGGGTFKLGSCRWGVYAFFDYDGEPIYVGQTNEMLRVRIRRHLTNRRTDAVAMHVLDPFEVCEVEVWPLPAYQTRPGGDAEAREHLDALESSIYDKCVEESVFKAILNEKAPPVARVEVQVPASFRGRIVTPAVSRLRDHPDLRIARRAQVMAALAQIISERKVAPGLRRALLTQAERLRWLAERRLAGARGQVVEEDAPE